MSALNKLVATALFGGAALVATLLHVSATITNGRPDSGQSDSGGSKLGGSSSGKPARPIETRVAVAHVSQSHAKPEAAMSSSRAILYADTRGHFFADIQVQGIPVRSLVDTGASIVAFSTEDAAKIGIRAHANDRKLQLNTANGLVVGSAITIPEIRLQGLIVHDVQAVIMPPGAMKGTLLGMSFMRKLTSYEAQGTSMIMRK